MGLSTIGPGAVEDTPAGYTIMRKDVEVAHFLWIPSRNDVTAVDRVYNEVDAPFGCRDHTGRVTRGKIQSWLRNRSIPAPRAGVAERLGHMGIESTSELMAMSLGLGLSDQY